MLSHYDIIDNMKTISVSVSETDYDAFREAAKRQHRSIAQLIREAMAYYRETKLAQRPRLTELPVFLGHRPLKPLPTRAEIYNDLFEDESDLS
jgi:hypothetical protein